MATSPETRIESVLISQISALSYISTNSIPVRSSDAMGDEKDKNFVNVSCQKASRIAPAPYNYYRSEVELQCVTHIPNDENQAIAENLYNTTNDYVQGLTISVLNAAVTESDLTVDGLVQGQNESDYDDNWRVKTIRFDCFYTYTTT